MSVIRGRVKNGVLEFDGPLPAEWNGREMDLQLSDELLPDDELNTDEKWRQFFVSIKDVQMSDAESTEFARILEEDKRLELSNWNRLQQTIDGLFP